MHSIIRLPSPPAQDPDADALDAASRRHLDAIRGSLEATRAFSAAPPGAKADAYRHMDAALREQADAERAYERLRQRVRGAAYVGRPRLGRY